MDGFSFTLGDPSIHQDDGPQNGRTTGGIAGLFRADEEEVSVGNASFRYGVRTEASAPAGDVAEGDGAKATRAAADTDAGGAVKAARAPVVVAATTLSQLYKVESGTHRPLGLAGLAAMASAGGFSLLCYNQSKQVGTVATYRSHSRTLRGQEHISLFSMIQRFDISCSLSVTHSIDVCFARPTTTAVFPAELAPHPAELHREWIGTIDS